MSVDIQDKLRSEPVYKVYLRQNSEWYKILIRNPERYTEFKEKMREKYKLRTIDKISRTMDAFTMISNLFSNMI